MQSSEKLTHPQICTHKSTFAYCIEATSERLSLLKKHAFPVGSCRTGSAIASHYPGRTVMVRLFRVQRKKYPMKACVKMIAPKKACFS